MRVPTTVRSDNSIAQRGAAAFRRETVSEQDASSPRSLAATLTRAFAWLAQLARAVGMIGVPDVYQDRTCGTAGAQFTIEHKLGHVARWSVVRWRQSSPSGGPGLVEVSSDTTRLVLASYVAGTADIEVK